MNGNDAGAPTGASAESGSLVSVEGQTDEGLADTIINGLETFACLKHPYERWEVRNIILAALRAKSEKPQSSGKKELEE